MNVHETGYQLPTYPQPNIVNPLIQNTLIRAATAYRDRVPVTSVQKYILIFKLLRAI